MTVKEITPLMEKLLETLWDLPGDIDLIGITSNLNRDIPYFDVQASEHIDTQRLAKIYGVPITKRENLDENGVQWTWQTAIANMAGSIPLKITSCDFQRKTAPGVTSTESGGAE